MNRPLKAEIILHFGNQCDAAVALDVQESAYHELSTDVYRPQVGRREALARVFGKQKVDDLLDGSDRPNAA